MRTIFQHAERVQVKVARVTWPGDTCDSVCLVDRSTNSGDSHEVCGGQRVLQVCEFAVREAVAVGTRGVLHISQEPPSVFHAEKLFLEG